MPDPNSFAVSTHTVTGSQLHAILNLNNDVLWYIFSVNAEMKQSPEGQTPALLTLRQTSQVCSHWRELSISSSSLWARVLNLNFLSQTRPDWREEVTRRAGTAALYIQASNLDFYQHRQWQLRWGVLRQLLNDHWARDRSLDVNVELFC
ncbi:hypothetical protein GALMADRAFT_136154 [Galerina marginata CBS 339.88]|uniref:F-box domain-containing protein n=1 Tax=Galerina marginata (strain CBS 339.88) TaxID=685588 RepID=A0A067TD16_GALM3|nr:hypothetical protein GALMADRAFT_136154 [Galerina marginata CBS 339.88]